MLLAIAAILDWEIHMIDVDSAFLHSKMPEDQTVYLSQPPGYIAEGKEDFVWKLSKALYGLKQSGHLWYQKLKGILELITFHACKSDPCVFIWSSSTATFIISSHVDDLRLYCSSKVKVKLLKSQIRKHISIKDLGEIQSLASKLSVIDKPTLSHYLTITTFMRLLLILVKQIQRMCTHLLKWVLTSLRLNAHQHQKRLSTCAPSHTRLPLDH